MKTIFERKSRRKGFTLVELLVAISVFSILVSIGVGGFVHALHTQREVASLAAVESNASLALEQMAREIRTGYLFCNGLGNTQDNACNPDVLGSGTGCVTTVGADGNVMTCNNILDFYNADGQNIDYELLPNGALAKSEGGPAGPFVPVTGDNVKIPYLTFTLFGNTEGDHWPPRITISMGVAPNSTDPALAGNVLNLETTASARTIDCTQGSPAAC